MKEEKLKWMMEQTGASREEILKQEKEIEALSPEEKEKLKKETEERQKMLYEILPSMMMGQVAIRSKEMKPGSFANMAEFGGKAQEYCKRFKCSMMEFMRDMKLVHNQFMRQTVDMGGGFDEKVHDVPKSVKKKNKRNNQEFKRESEGRGMTIGEMLKRKEKKK